MRENYEQNSEFKLLGTCEDDAYKSLLAFANYHGCYLRPFPCFSSDVLGVPCLYTFHFEMEICPLSFMLKALKNGRRSAENCIAMEICPLSLRRNVLMNTIFVMNVCPTYVIIIFHNTYAT